MLFSFQIMQAVVHGWPQAADGFPLGVTVTMLLCPSTTCTEGCHQLLGLFHIPTGLSVCSQRWSFPSASSSLKKRSEGPPSGPTFGFTAIGLLASHDILLGPPELQLSLPTTLKFLLFHSEAACWPLFYRLKSPWPAWPCDHNGHMLWSCLTHT